MIRPICTESAIKHQPTIYIQKRTWKSDSKWHRFNITIMITIMVVMWVTDFVQESFPFWLIFKNVYRYIIIIIWWTKIKLMMHFCILVQLVLLCYYCSVLALCGKGVQPMKTYSTIPKGFCWLVRKEIKNISSVGNLLCSRPHRVEALSDDARLTSLWRLSVCRVHRA